ncbi:MAG: hypothetical protein CFH06_01568 [Alphaproteobacteria bacterium MarineAlpha3_Bin5]|nr:aldehyde dehydrogenase [Magnetovibrio sp.]PPR76904.1 MAG: hypothetical protein CFH06_01568 [Alphaproteobacteria bacterium MarineAlpha3_Bin5]
MVNQNTKNKVFLLNRRLVAKKILAARSDILLVTGLGSTTWDFAATKDRDLTFPLWGAMGSATPIGLGIAISKKDRHVVVITGDGEMLMGIGALATVGIIKPKNLSICIFDNGHYGETGMQKTATSYKCDLALTAKGLGINNAGSISTNRQLHEQIPEIVRGPGPLLRVIKVKAESLPFVLPPKDGVKLKNRFQAALL